MNELQIFISNQGLTVLPDTKQWINRFEIQSESSNRIYIIAQRANLTEWGCSCPGWRIHRNCKHLNTVLPLIQRATQTTQKQLS